MAAKDVTAYPRLFRYADSYLPRTVTKVKELLDGVNEAKVEERLYLSKEEQKLVCFVKTTVSEGQRDVEMAVKERRRKSQEVNVHECICTLEERIELLEKKYESLEMLLKKGREGGDDDRESDNNGEDGSDDRSSSDGSDGNGSSDDSDNDASSDGYDGNHGKKQESQGEKEKEKSAGAGHRR